MKKIVSIVVALFMVVSFSFSTPANAKGLSLTNAQVNGKYKLTSKKLTTYCAIEGYDYHLKAKKRSFKITSKTKIQWVNEDDNYNRTTFKGEKRAEVIKMLNKNQITIQFTASKGKVKTLRYWDEPYNESDVSILNNIINEQKAKGAKVSSDLKSGQYWWGSDGRLNGIYWPETSISGTLSIKGLDLLKELDCSDNQITELDLSECPSFEKLECRDNKLTALNLSGLPSLCELYCSGNQINVLDLKGLSSLWALDCSENQITELDLSECSSLMDLECNNNNLSTLNISKMSYIRNIICHNNSISTLDISGRDEDSNNLEIKCDNNVTVIGANDDVEIYRYKVDFDDEDDY